MIRTVISVGHSNHEPAAFLGLLREAGIEEVMDVRSQPYSRFAPQFNLASLRSILEQQDIQYTHDQNLGGRPANADMYDSAGHVLYGRLARSSEFTQALVHLEGAASTSQLAIMCGEEDPTDCHRRLLIGKVLVDRGWHLDHLRGDGTLMSEDELADVSGGIEQGLFEGSEFSA